MYMYGRMHNSSVDLPKIKTRNPKSLLKSLAFCICENCPWNRPEKYLFLSNDTVIYKILQ